MSKTTLSRREHEVLTYLIKGFSSKEIAQVLCVAPSTIETHKKNMYKKLNVRKVTELAVYGIQHLSNHKI